MTRINLVPPEELMDQHLFAEFREIKMVPKSLARSIAARGVQGVQKRIPTAFTLNTGHVSFFYDKGAYLVGRYALLRQELERRGINFNRESELDPDGTLPDVTVLVRGQRGAGNARGDERGIGQQRPHFVRR